MMADHRRDDIKPFASPPCFAHELTSDGAGFTIIDPQQQLDVMRWRQATRRSLLVQRAELSVDERNSRAERLGRHLIDFIASRYTSLTGHIISGYWPIKSELDLRGSLETIRQQGAQMTLPVVVEKAKPLEFYAWKMGDKMDRGFWNIPVPAIKMPLQPDILLAPLVGWDRWGYRLGYGGGYFDRTLASLSTPRCVIGVGLQSTALPTIFPQPYDVRLDAILTEDGVQWCVE